MRLRIPLMAFATLLLAFSCEKKKEEPAPQPVKPEIKIPAESQAAFNNGITFDSGSSESAGTGNQKQSTTVKFTATETWSASVVDTKASTWLSVLPTSGGAGTVTMTVTAQPNTTDKARSATVSIQCGTVKQSFTVKQDAAQSQTVEVESITLNTSELSLAPGASETLSATVLPENATDKTVTWSTSNAEIATVTDGKVTAVKEGEAIITAKAGEKEATCKVTVKAAVIAVKSVTLNKTELALTPGESETLTVTVAPENATDKTVTWSSSDEEIASVDQEGVVQAVAEGSAMIIACVSDKTDTCFVTVKKSIVVVEKLTLDKLELALTKGQSETLVATVEPDDATDKTLFWTSSDAEVASVDENGKVSALKSGNATITARAGEKDATCEVTVTTPVDSISLTLRDTTLQIGESAVLFAIVYPEDADDKKVSWGSSNEAVASVDQNGEIKALAGGNTIITAMAGGKQDTCTVSVLPPSVYVFSIDPTSVDIPDTGGPFTITVTCSGTYERTSKPSWIAEQDVRANVYTFVVDLNHDTAERKGTIVFTDSKGNTRSCSVKQNGATSTEVGGVGEGTTEEIWN